MVKSLSGKHKAITEADNFQVQIWHSRPHLKIMVFQNRVYLFTYLFISFIPKQNNYNNYRAAYIYTHGLHT